MPLFTEEVPPVTSMRMADADTVGIRRCYGYKIGTRGLAVGLR